MTPIARTLALAVPLTIVLLGGSPDAAEGQTFGPSLAGTVYDAESGRALPDSRIVADRRGTASDSLGRWTLDAMPPGVTRIRVLHFGYTAFDTTVTVPAAGAARFDVRLRSSYLEKAARDAVLADIAAGRTDSSARGLLHRSPSDSALTFAAFGARFLRNVAAERAADSNTVLSPTSAAFALSIPLLGADGATATEIETALGVRGMDRDLLRQRTAAAMTAGIDRSDVQLEIANAIWVDTSVVLHPTFVEAVASYRATVRTQLLEAQSAVDDINAWADHATHGKIAELLKERLPDSSQLYIANAVYFKGKWLDEFDKAKTRPRDFRTGSGKVVRVDGMERTGHVGYARGDRYQMIRLPYRGGRFAMYVVLPDAGTSAEKIEEQFASRGMPASLVQKDFRDVHLVMPRLHAELSYNLGPALTSLGIRRAFDCNDAEFGGIATKVAGIGLCIAKASQTVYLDVDEEGTEAAAVTGLLMVTMVGLGPPPIEFVVDRPFLFLLRDEQTGADLFVGTIRRP